MPYPSPTTYPGATTWPGTMQPRQQPGVEVPHFRFPFIRVGGAPPVVEQDVAEHVFGCVELITCCPVGFRLERPDFGVPWHDYRTTVIPAGVMQTAIREFEDRAKIATDVARNRETGDALITVEVEVASG
jgi:hypothetical protein